MVKLKDLLKEVVDVPAIQNQSTRLSQDFIQFIKELENREHRGRKNGKWYPHKSTEGGMPTIGYGHKIHTKTQLKSFLKGISDADVNRLLIDDLTKAQHKVKEYIQDVYKVNVAMTISQDEMLTEFAFNTGGLEKFPKFVDAVLRSNWDTARKEYKRYGHGNELTLRNELFFDRYLK